MLILRHKRPGAGHAPRRDQGGERQGAWERRWAFLSTVDAGQEKPREREQGVYGRQRLRDDHARSDPSAEGNEQVSPGRCPIRMRTHLRRRGMAMIVVVVLVVMAAMPGIVVEMMVMMEAMIMMMLAMVKPAVFKLTSTTAQCRR
eukprot:2688655-Rhodomonas_salina.3